MSAAGAGGLTGGRGRCAARAAGRFSIRARRRLRRPRFHRAPADGRRMGGAARNDADRRGDCRSWLAAGERGRGAGVAELCERLGVPHYTLVWTGAKPSTRLQERAREARYRLLAEKARAIGADIVVTAHHADDQAETVLFRLMRGSGVAGLRGMEPMSRRNGVTIARPLLGVGKSALVAFARARGCGVRRRSVQRGASICAPASARPDRRPRQRGSRRGGPRPSGPPRGGGG